MLVYGRKDATTQEMLIELIRCNRRMFLLREDVKNIERGGPSFLGWVQTIFSNFWEGGKECFPFTDHFQNFQGGLSILDKFRQVMKKITTNVPKCSKIGQKYPFLRGGNQIFDKFQRGVVNVFFNKPKGVLTIITIFKGGI